MSSTMLAAVLERPGQLSLLRIPVPTLGGDEVLIRVEACGICGSDLRYFAGDNPWARQTLGVVRPNPPNMVLGHEVAGTIVAAGGPGGQGRIGERVVLLAYQGCNACIYCWRGDHHLCAHVTHHGHGAGWRGRDYNPGGMAELCPATSNFVVRLPDCIPFDEATLLDGLAVAVHAVDLSRIVLGDSMAVIGSGPIGLCVAQAARAAGAARVFAIDVVAGPLRVARELGMDALDASACDPLKAVLDATDARGIDAVFDTVGTAATRRQGISMLQRGGRLVCLAGSEEPLGLDYSLLTGERVVMTASNAPYDDLFRAIKLARSGRIRLSPMVTHRYPLDEVEQAFGAARERERTGAVKVVLQPPRPLSGGERELSRP